MENPRPNPRVLAFFRDLDVLSSLPISARQRDLAVDEYPFDGQLLARSRLYRASRSFYRELGGKFTPRLFSTLRALSEADLFDNEIDFAPMRTELAWLAQHRRKLTAAQAEAEVAALLHFNDISLFHEQNHRVVWRLLPPAPHTEAPLRRYLNFAESLVVMLDVAVADEVGPLSDAFFRMNLLYRRAGTGLRRASEKQLPRRYLLAVFYATYCLLEGVVRSDVKTAVAYVFPDQAKLNAAAVRCSLALNPDFAALTNPRWQQNRWRHARARLRALHAGTKHLPLALPEDPLDLAGALDHAQRILRHYGL